MNTEKLVKKVNKHDNDIIKVNEQLIYIVRKKNRLCSKFRSKNRV